MDVQLYIDQAGWIVAFLTTGDIDANIFTFTKWDTAKPKLDTVLEEAMKQTATAIGQTIDPAKIGWYDWAHPNATHLAASARYGEGKMFMAYPQELLSTVSRHIPGIVKIRRSLALMLLAVYLLLGSQDLRIR